MKKSIFILYLIIQTCFTSYSQDKIDLLFRSEKILADGDTTRALAAFQEILRLYPQSFAAAMRLAEINYAVGDYYKAVQFCNISIDITDNFLESQNKSLLALGLPADTSRNSRKFITDQAYMHQLKGQIRIKQDRPLDAEHELQKSLTLNPHEYQVYIDLGLLYINQGRFDEGKSLLKKASLQKETKLKGLLNLASLHYKLKEMDSAQFYYQELVTVFPKNKWAYLYLGNIQSNLSEFQKSIEYYTQYIAIDSMSEEAYYRRAVSNIELTQWEAALEDWSKVLSLNEKNEQAWRNRGLTYFQLKNYDEAIEDFGKALEYEPSQPYTQINRGYCLYLTNEPKKALKDINEGLEIVPKYYLGHYFKALCYYQIHKKKNTCSSLKQAIELGLKDDEIDPRLMKKCY